MTPDEFLAALRATSPGPALIELRTGEVVVVRSSDNWCVSRDGRSATVFPHPRGGARQIVVADVAAVARGGDAAAPHPERITVDEYEKMLADGILPESNRYELIEGRIVVKAHYREDPAGGEQ